MMNVAFIGLGIMGTPMAHNLHKAGHTVFVHGRRPESMAPLAEAGCTACKTAAEVASLAEIIIVMVSDTPDVEQAGGRIRAGRAQQRQLELSRGCGAAARQRGTVTRSWRCQLVRNGEMRV